MKQPKPEQYHEKKRHTEDQFPYNTYLCTIPDDFTEVPVHWHEEAELIVIQKGSGTVLVDLTHYHVAAGDIIIVLPEHLHAIREISGQKMEYENIIFRPELLSSDNHDVCFEKFLYPLFSGQIHTVVHIHPRLSYYPKIHDLIRISTCAQRLSVSFHVPASFSGRKKRIIQHTATVTGQVEIHHHFHE